MEFADKEEKEIVEEIERIRSFCNNHSKIFIYGAGNYGRGYLSIIESFGYEATGFVVSKKSDEKYLGKKIYGVDEINKLNDSLIGIIPAFTNSNVVEIARKFKNSNVDVIDINHQMMLHMEKKIMLNSIMDELDEEFGVSHNITSNVELKNILIVRLDAIGDLVLTIPFIREMRNNYKKSKISVIIRKQNESIMKTCPYVDKVYLYDSDLDIGGLTEQCMRFREIREKVGKFVNESFKNEKFDGVFIPRQLLCGRNALDELAVAYLCGAKYKIGQIANLNIQNRMIYSRMIKSLSMICLQNKAMHEIEFPLGIITGMGGIIKNKKLELWISEENRKYAKTIINCCSENKITYIAVGLVASNRTKTWNVENYFRLIELSLEHINKDFKFVLMGGNEAETEAGRLNAFKDSIIDLTGKTNLEQAMAIMEQCDMYIGSNTGLLHFASAFAKPSVVIYSELEDGLPSDGASPCRWGAWMVEHIDLLPPAGLDGCHRFCKKMESHCINLITPEQVLSAINELIKYKIN